ncbi:MAG: hypothetical protein AAF961_06370 [Planctomycetota bacterium]
MACGFPRYDLRQHQDVVGLDRVLAIQSYLSRSLCSHSSAGQLLQQRFSAAYYQVNTGHGFDHRTTKEAESTVKKRDEFLLRMLQAERASTSIDES